ncbi:MAG: recombinase family protein [Clostridia bacterium]
MTIAWAYCRFSSDHQREESIDAQIRAIRDYCRHNRITLEKIYRDEARSATDDRPSFQQMFSDIKEYPCDLVIVHKLDRFSRDRYDSAFYKRKLKERGIRLVSVLENIDGSPESIILESVLEGMSEYYSRNLAREVQKGKKETAYKCLHNGGVPPIGYQVDESGKYHVDPIESKWIIKAYEMKASGRSYMEIAAYLNGIGARTRRRQGFTKNSFMIFSRMKSTRAFMYITGQLRRQPESGTII